MQQVKNGGQDFAPIRMMGTLSWIVIGLAIGYMKFEATATPFLLATGASVVMSIFSLTLLPHTPPRAKAKQLPSAASWGSTYFR